MSALNTQILGQPSTNPIIHNHITVHTAAKISGYNVQYLRRLLRAGKLKAVKVGQVWLIHLASLNSFLKQTDEATDHRCAPHKPQSIESSTNVNTLCVQMYTSKRAGKL